MLASNPPRNNRSKTHRIDEGAAVRVAPLPHRCDSSSMPRKRKSGTRQEHYFLGLATPNPEEPFFIKIASNLSSWQLGSDYFSDSLWAYPCDGAIP